MSPPLQLSLYLTLVVTNIPTTLSKEGLQNILGSEHIVDVKLVTARGELRGLNYAYLTVTTTAATEKVVQRIHMKPPLNLKVEFKFPCTSKNFRHDVEIPRLTESSVDDDKEEDVGRKKDDALVNSPSGGLIEDCVPVQNSDMTNIKDQDVDKSKNIFVFGIPKHCPTLLTDMSQFCQSVTVLFLADR